MFCLKNRLAALMLIVATSLTMLSCDVNFKSIDDYNAASKVQKLEAFNRVLSRAGVATPDSNIVRYLALALDDGETLTLLQDILDTDNFDTIFDNGIPILYFAYSPEVLKLARGSTRENVRKFIISSWSYNFSEGDSLFREYLEIQLEKGSIFLFAWLPPSNKSQDEYWSGIDIDFQTKILNTTAWRDGDGFDFALFQKLSINQQATLLRQNFFLNMINNGSLEDNTGKMLDIMETQWQTLGYDLLQSQNMMGLNDDSPFRLVSDKALQAIIGSFK
jgi:hypothetical protein